ncbi:hypothetical protein ACQF4J_47255 (plasmid) [Streptomyces sp. C1-1]|uniref:hypothetical protein n=2 Tax=unclassified Streptomyces TaxID=2593676 RepID=UPI003D01BF30
MRVTRLVRRLAGRIHQDPAPAEHRSAAAAATPAPAVMAAHDAPAELAPLPGKDGRRTGRGGPAGRAATRVTVRLRAGFDEALARPDRGDISITTVIIWVAAVTGAVLVAGTIALVIAKYNGQLGNL